jgi:adenosylcobinamide-GDP ribazoletransferase
VERENGMKIVTLLREEARVFWTAVMFFTRVPVPGWVDHGRAWLERAPRYFPLVGAGVGVVGAAVWWLAAHVWPNDIAVVLSMVATILLTGAFHEDGFADVCDGFGGGFTKKKVLEIMKDSRVGAYGAMGVALMLGLKFLALRALPPGQFVGVVVAGHAVSRWGAVTLLATLPYVREEADAKAKPMATELGAGPLVVATGFGVGPLLGLATWSALSGLGAVLVVRVGLARWFVKRIGGYTGDCLGAAQQVSEVAFYLAILAVNGR